MRRISQAKTAEIAGLPCAEFLAALADFDVSLFQYDANDIVAEAVEPGRWVANASPMMALEYRDQCELLSRLT